MKKAFLLCLVAVFGVCAVLAAPSYIKSKYVGTQVITPSYVTYCDTVVANGVVAYKDQQVLTSSVPIVASKIYFNEGDAVEKGDVIADVDVLYSAFNAISTISTMAQTSSQLSSSFSELAPLLSQIPSGLLDQSNFSFLDSSFNLPDKIIATTSGRLTSMNLSTYLPATELVTIIPSNQMVAEVLVPEEEISKIKLDQTAKIYGSAFPTTCYEGTVTKIAQTATKKSATNSQTIVKVQVSFSGDEKIKSGYNVKAQIGASDEREMLVLPYSAINQDGDSEFVYCFENSRAVKKNIVAGVETQDCVEIISGINPNDKVLLDSTKIKQNLQRISID